MPGAEPFHHRPATGRHRHLLRVGDMFLPIPKRAAEVARLLLRHPAGMTRVEMLNAAPPGLALNATCHVARLRKAGCPIESVPAFGTDADGNKVSFVRYRLAGAIAVTAGPWPMLEDAA
ncbi:hypothetical protein [Falsiroseomonas stagni]|uniref:Uncharacterized protein n=1 Tax=Falsiroseomonas stagni DSM 19981 TaxID=1123062 RepID=A0A1I4E3A3_9PROT|nr:hypothetical protein [Falsiroseomonas stagni]SFK99440.1 hypothetical protein SAMN02745775_113126 [Falsiroseomonas stagni DSM 19981]